MSSQPTEDQSRDLAEILPDDLFNHPDCFDSHFYLRWEREVATPAIEAAGFTVGKWRTTDGDSFGPLVRAVTLTKEGVTETYSYG